VKERIGERGCLRRRAGRGQEHQPLSRGLGGPRDVVAQCKRHIVDPLDVVHDDQCRLHGVECAVHRFEDAHRLERRCVIPLEHESLERCACPGNGPKRTQHARRRRERDASLRLIADDAKRRVESESIRRLGEQARLATAGIAGDDGGDDGPFRDRRREVGDRLQLIGPPDERSHARQSVERLCSDY
jgi:hypothetical protein